MGEIVYQSYQALQQRLAAEGRTITAEAVDYPAKDVPARCRRWGLARLHGQCGCRHERPRRAVRGVHRAVPDHQGRARRLLAGRDGGAPEPGEHRRRSQSCRRPPDRRRRPASERHHRQHRLGVARPREDGRRRAGLADPGSCTCAAAREHRSPDHQRLRRRRRRLRLRPRRRRGLSDGRRDSHQLHHRRRGRTDVDMDGAPAARQRRIDART